MRATRIFTASDSTARLIYWLLGPIVWAVHFSVVYLAHTLICARPLLTGESLVAMSRIVVIAATAVALAALAWLIRSAHAALGRATARASETSLFQNRMVLLLSVLAVFGVFWSGAAALLVLPCAALR
jgi:hypothetical protein